MTNKNRLVSTASEVATNPVIIKVLQPDSILKYDCSKWYLQDVSIDTMVNEINKAFV